MVSKHKQPQGVQLAALLPRAAASPDPPNLPALECAFNTLALEFGTARVPSSSVPALRDALNVAQICGPGVFGGEDAAAVEAQLAAASAEFAAAASATAAALPLRPLAAATFSVAVDGDDSNPGTLAAPFATPARARDAARGVPMPTRIASGGVAVYLRGGVYDLSAAPLELNASDAYTAYASYPGERATLSGAKSLAGLAWAPVGGGPVLVADVGPLLRGADARLEAWLAAAPAGRSAAPPPPVINSLFVNGERQPRARYPNGNPHDGSGICFSASQRPGEGCTTANGYSSCINGDGGARQPAPGAVAKVTGITPNRGASPTRGCAQCTTYGTFEYSIFPPPPNHPVYNKPLPGHGWPNTSHFTFWGSLFDRSAAAVLTTSCDAHWARAVNWSNADFGVMQTFHASLWGGQSYALGNGSRASGGQVTVPIAYGGYQEARGSYIGRQHFYMENIREELDAPGEWYYDPRAYKLYAYPNMTAAEWAAAAVSISTQATVVSVVGAPGAPAANITLDGLTFTGSSTTFLEQYEVPSGGDWSIHRGGAVFVQDAERLQVTGCAFNATGGNGLFLSNHVADSIVEGNEFVYTGDSAIALLGAAVLADGSAPTYPNRVTIARNVMHETGIFGKQSSCVAMSLTANLTVLDNVCYNGPRAGINSNDGFGGGSVIQGNLVFNAVRETGDHGPYNSWDRQPYWTASGVVDGFNDPAGRSLLKAADVQTRNFMINGYNSVWTFDHDDGSQFFNDTANLMVFGGCKNYLGNSKSCDSNVIIYPGIQSRSSGSRQCQTDDNGNFANQYHHDNYCVTSTNGMYSFSNCNAGNVNTSAYHTFNNKLFSPDGSFNNCGVNSFARWQQLGQDAGSTLAVTPPLADMLAAARAVLAM